MICTVRALVLHFVECSFRVESVLPVAQLQVQVAVGVLGLHDAECPTVVTSRTDRLAAGELWWDKAAFEVTGWIFTGKLDLNYDRHGIASRNQRRKISLFTL